jgi:hypothetical protein
MGWPGYKAKQYLLLVSIDNAWEALTAHLAPFAINTHNSVILIILLLSQGSELLTS